MTKYAWSVDDVILYNIAVGATGTEQTWEEGLVALPTFGVLPAFSIVAPLVQAAGVSLDSARVLHGEHELLVDGPVPTAASVRNEGRVMGIYDKGHGDLVRVEVHTYIQGKETPLFTNRYGIFVRGASGFGKSDDASPAPSPPSRRPDEVVRVQTHLSQAALYRLCGDRNPIHIDPAAAAAAGLERPIMHGLCTLAVIARAVGGDAVQAVRGRFAGVLYPGETIVVELWRDGNSVEIRALCEERRTPVVTNATINLRSSS
ncbi:MAG: MaoC family dehydratase N-terminal domain-containing protein [Actinobacteria bacterium]|nr:MaoC family dehydratase N-terminal domain-containing protein [Actinomycetota bacterium]